MNILNNIKLTYKHDVIKNKDNWKYNSYKCKIQYNKQFYSFNYHIGMALDTNQFTIKDIMFALLSDANFGKDTFESFCNEIGYNTDSINALSIYKQCIKTSKKLDSMFNEAELRELNILLSDY